MYNGTKKAYMTIEASLIFPVLLCGIIFIIYIGFYLYNAGTIKQAAYIAALRGSQVKHESLDTVERYVEQELEKMLMNRMLVKENMENKVKVSLNKVNVEIEFAMKVPFLQWFFPEIKLWKIEEKAEAARINPVDIIRNVRKINGSQISE